MKHTFSYRKPAFVALIGDSPERRMWDLDQASLANIALHAENRGTRNEARMILDKKYDVSACPLSLNRRESNV